MGELRQENYFGARTALPGGEQTIKELQYTAKYDMLQHNSKFILDS